ncbi:MAG: hypothetical protein ACHQ1D_05275 [Nitrososphaerales archaeon]
MTRTEPPTAVENVSQKLRLMLEEVNQAFGHAKEAVLAAYNQALSEGFSPEEARKLLLKSTKTVKQRTIYLYLPDECKNKHMQNIAIKRKSLQNCSDNLHRKQISDCLVVTDQTRCLPERNKDDKSDIYIQEIRNTLSKREITEEIFEESRLLDEKDKIIKEKERTITELKKLNDLKENNDFQWILLPDRLSFIIHEKVGRSSKRGGSTKFGLKHDGHYVLEIVELDFL